MRCVCYMYFVCHLFNGIVIFCMSSLVPTHTQIRRQTPLHVACELGHQSLVELMLEYEANKTSTDLVNRMCVSSYEDINFVYFFGGVVFSDL